MGDSKARVSVIGGQSRKSLKKSQYSFSGRSATSRVRMRRPTYGYSSVPGIRPLERTSNIGPEFRRPPLLYLNTYQLEPLVPFHTVHAQMALDELLDELFTGHVYNAQASPTLALRMAGDLMRRIKYMGFNRYRVITVATVAQKRAQSYNNAIAFLWDHDRDNYVNAQRETNTAFIQVTAFGIYLD